MEETRIRRRGGRNVYRARSSSKQFPAYEMVRLRPVCHRVCGDCAQESRLPIHPSVCFKVGRFTITQSSWTAPRQRCSRKWMSGHAAIALVLLRDRGQFATLTICPLGEPILPSQGESPFPVDFYLSWMSPGSSSPGSSPGSSPNDKNGVRRQVYKQPRSACRTCAYR